ncbi:MAG: hypothetical protein JO260_01830 [Acidobacteria bacterium]|nr:hypothetical protein [Acidobacteriota bacterium]
MTEKLVTVQAAYEDFLQRSLSKLSCDLARLIYLASTRDYNTGSYHHDGLASRFSPEIAAKALEMAHREAFLQLSARSLEELVQQLKAYFESSHDEAGEILRMWQKLEPYRIAIPVEVNPAVARLFLSNVRLALAIWRSRQDQSLQGR